MNEQNDVPASYRSEPVPLTEFRANGSPELSRIVYRGEGTVIIAGVCFHRVYVFSPQEPEQWVEAEDVAPLMTTGLFRIRR